MSEKFGYSRCVRAYRPDLPDRLYEILDSAEGREVAPEFGSYPTMDELLPFANEGITEAIYNIGVMYDLGHGIAQDHKEAFNWYSEAAKHGAPKAMFNCGVCYELGEGVKKDFEMAMNCYRDAAKEYEEECLELR
jgi:hypothetical protein